MTVFKYTHYPLPIMYLFESNLFNFLISFILSYQINLEIASTTFFSFFFF